MNDKCPWCSANLEPPYACSSVVRWFECGTKPGGQRANQCYERQIANLQSQLKSIAEATQHEAI